MTTGRFLPIDDGDLNRAWNAINQGSGSAQPVEVPPDVAELLLQLQSLDPSSSSESVRERAWGETWQRISQSQPAKEESMQLKPISLNGNQASWAVIPAPAKRNRIKLDDRYRWIALGLAALIVMAIIGGYAIDCYGGSDDPNLVPAAVQQAATPSAETDPTFVLEASLAASDVISSPGTASGFDHTTVYRGSTYSYRPECCRGPWFVYLAYGELTLSSAAPVQVFRADGSEETIEANATVDIQAGDGYLVQNDANLDVTIPADAESAAELLSWILTDDPRFNGHDDWGYPMANTADIKVDMTVNPGPATLVVRHYSTFDAIPEPAENQYSYIMEESTKFGSLTYQAPWQFLPPVGTPTAAEANPTYWVLEFNMSPPGAASPETGTPSP